MELASTWHQYLPLCFYVVFFTLTNVSVHSCLHFKSDIDQSHIMVYGLLLLTRANLKGLKPFENACLMSTRVRFVFVFVYGLICRFALRKGLIL